MFREPMSEKGTRERGEKFPLSFVSMTLGVGEFAYVGIARSGCATRSRRLGRSDAAPAQS